jgi:hypothetical protein
LEGFLGGTVVGEIAFQKDVAAQAVQEGVRKVQPALLGGRQAFLDRRQRALIVPCRSFELGKKTQKRGS